MGKSKFIIGFLGSFILNLHSIVIYSNDRLTIYSINNKYSFSKKIPDPRKKKIIQLSIANYKDSIFPNDIILEYTELVELQVHLVMPNEVARQDRYDLVCNKIKIDTIRLKKLKKLKKLSLGWFPFEQLPIEFSILDSLEILNINYTNIDSIPSCIKYYKNLKSIDFYGNKIKYISEDIINLKKLEKIDLQDNLLSNIPEPLMKISSLKELNLSNEWVHKFPFVSLNDINLENNKPILNNLLYKSSINKLSIFISNCSDASFIKTNYSKEIESQKLVTYFFIYDCK